MDNQHMIEKLQRAGVQFAPGLSDAELKEIESFFGFRFPAEIRSFLACARPISGKFFDWTDRSHENLERFRAFFAQMEEAFRLDFEENGLTAAWLGEDCTQLSNQAHLAKILDALHASPRLIPFYAHRCFFDAMDGMPIISFWQPTDSIVYGTDFEQYLQVEFLGHPLPDQAPVDRLKNTGIWAHLIE